MSSYLSIFTVFGNLYQDVIISIFSIALCAVTACVKDKRLHHIFDFDVFAKTSGAVGAFPLESHHCARHQLNITVNNCAVTLCDLSFIYLSWKICETIYM